MNQIIQTQKKRPSWSRRRIIQINIPSPIQPTAVNPPESHPDYFAVLKALNERRIGGQIVSITSQKPVCSEWHEVYAIELGYYHDQRRVVFALVKFGGSE